MPWTILLSVAAHHGDAADPELLEWIKDRLDHILGLGPWVIVGLLGLVIVALPLSLMVLYMVQRRQAATEPYGATGDRQ